MKTTVVYCNLPLYVHNLYSFVMFMTKHDISNAFPFMVYLEIPLFINVKSNQLFQNNYYNMYMIYSAVKMT